MDMLKAGIIGATGYAGAELCRILMGHPHAEIAAISSVSFEGQALSEVYPAYLGLIDKVCRTQEEVCDKSDVVFAALPHGLSETLAKVCSDAGKVFIDLGADFRLSDEDTYHDWYGGNFTEEKLHREAIYGLPEIFREKITGKNIIANPGCYTTAVPLAIYPALKAGYIEHSGIIADCKSGSTGAGRSLSQQMHFPELNENFYAYKIAAHRHTPEIEQTLSAIAEKPMKITFLPHLLPVNRGILATCYCRLKSGVTPKMLQDVYEETYKDEYFIRLLPQGQSPQIRNVRYSNFCDISFTVDEHTNTLVAVSAIDNMVKGAAGQAVQNMNLCFNLGEIEGLILIPPAI